MQNAEMKPNRRTLKNSVRRIVECGQDCFTPIEHYQRHIRWTKKGGQEVSEYWLRGALFTGTPYKPMTNITNMSWRIYRVSGRG